MSKRITFHEARQIASKTMQDAKDGLARDRAEEAKQYSESEDVMSKKTTASELAGKLLNVVAVLKEIALDFEDEEYESELRKATILCKQAAAELRRLEMEISKAAAALSPLDACDLDTAIKRTFSWGVEKQARIAELEKLCGDTLETLGAGGARVSSLVNVAQTRMTEIVNLYERMEQERKKYAGQHAQIKKLKDESLGLHKAGCDGYEEQQARIKKLEAAARVIRSDEAKHPI